MVNKWSIKDSGKGSSNILIPSLALSKGVKIQSDQEISTNGVIGTELNKTVSLVCHINGSSYQNQNLVWLRNDAEISLKEGNREGRSSVCITPVIHADNGATFTCYLSKNSSSRASITLNVTCKSLLAISPLSQVDTGFIFARLTAFFFSYFNLIYFVPQTPTRHLTKFLEYLLQVFKASR